jgi:PLP dependent protein
MAVGLEERYSAIQAEIAKMEKESGRELGSASLLAVSKGQSAESIAALYRLGQRDFAENYLQEALEKQRRLDEVAAVWHFIGRIQANKTKLIAENFSWVHAVESQKIILRLERARQESGLPPLQVCLQVNISHDPDKAGVAAPAVAELCEVVRGCTHLRLRGLMAILRSGQSEEDALVDYRKMASLLAELNRKSNDLDTLSMGMSADFSLAVAAGASWVRIGQALFGKRINN